MVSVWFWDGLEIVGWFGDGLGVVGRWLGVVWGWFGVGLGVVGRWLGVIWGAGLGLVCGAIGLLSHWPLERVGSLP